MKQKNIKILAIFAVVFSLLTLMVIIGLNNMDQETKKEDKRDNKLSYLVALADMMTHPKAMQSGYIKDEKILQDVLKLVSENEAHLCEINGIYKFTRDSNNKPNQWFCSSVEMLPNLVIEHI